MSMSVKLQAKETPYVFRVHPVYPKKTYRLKFYLNTCEINLGLLQKYSIIDWNLSPYPSLQGTLDRQVSPSHRPHSFKRAISYPS